MLSLNGISLSSPSFQGSESYEEEEAISLEEPVGMEERKETVPPRHRSTTEAHMDGQRLWK